MQCETGPNVDYAWDVSGPLPSVEDGFSVQWQGSYVLEVRSPPTSNAPTYLPATEGRSHAAPLAISFFLGRTLRNLMDYGRLNQGSVPVSLAIPPYPRDPYTPP